MNIKSALNWANAELIDCHDSAKLDSEVLLAHLFEKDRSYLYTWPEHDLAPDLLVQFKDSISKRKSGVPVAYLLGNKEFWSLNLSVTSDTLIPRPETELLVEQVLNLVAQNDSCTIVDLGTGSGAIALAIASERRNCSITASDKSLLALDVAKLNAQNNHITNIQFIQSDWFKALANRQFTIILSNPPYVAEHDPLLSQGDVRFEPPSALKSGPDGLDDIRLISKTASSHLLPDGWLLLEHGFEQGEAVQQILSGNGYNNISTISDLSGQPRVTIAQY